jgi:ATP-binding cassette subfamily B (MDR/TAP) protein 1
VLDARIAGRIAYDVIDKKVEIDSKAKGIEVTNESLKGKIEFKNVNFSYPTRENLKVMVDFSAVFEPGKTTALVGPSGGGKSTIIQLLERYYNPKSGEILVDGKPIKDY